MSLQLNHAIEGKTEMFENVNVEWNLFQDDHLYDNADFSDDDLDSVHVSSHSSLTSNVNWLSLHELYKDISEVD